MRSSRLEFVLSSLALPFDNTGELLPVGLGTSFGEVTFSSVHQDTGKRIGDGVLPVRSTMGCSCHQNTLYHGGGEHPLTMGVALLFSVSCGSNGCSSPVNTIHTYETTDIPQL